MAGGSTLRIGLITGAVLLTVGIYLLPKNKFPDRDKPAREAKSETADFSIEELVLTSRPKLDKAVEQQLGSWEKSITVGGDQNLYDSIAAAWDAARMPGIAAWYFEKKATVNKNETDWQNASYRYFDAYKNAPDSMQAQYFANKAIKSYSEVIAINPHNLNARTDLGILYAEATAEPMKGILMLRDVVKENPKHENAQLNLGFLSMKSGQMDKALERFQSVLEINPSRIDMYLYQGEALLRKGNKKEALEKFEVFRNLTNDPNLVKEVDAYIKSIKESGN